MLKLARIERAHSQLSIRAKISTRGYHHAELWSHRVGVLNLVAEVENDLCSAQVLTGSVQNRSQILFCIVQNTTKIYSVLFCFCTAECHKNRQDLVRRPEFVGVPVKNTRDLLRKTTSISSSVQDLQSSHTRPSTVQ